VTYETLEGTEKLEAEVKKLKMMLFQVREDRDFIVEEKLALERENETLKIDANRYRDFWQASYSRRSLDQY